MLVGFTPLLLLTAAHALSRARQRPKQFERNGLYVSPIAGCRGFDCVLQYIKLPDEHFAWYDTEMRLTGTASSTPGTPSMRWTGYVLNMTSQRWVTSRVDWPIWWHTLVVIVPEVVEFRDWATLTLDFGIELADGSLVRIDNRPPDHETDSAQNGPGYAITSDNLHSMLPKLKRTVAEAAQIAVRVRAPAAALMNLPNSAETFADDPLHMQRSGDFLKEYTYEEFLNHPDEPERIMDLPVAKAVVRAMDTIQAFTAALPSGRVKRFGVTGFSKLGTATWMAGAADPRVKAIVPIAIYLTIAGGPTVKPTAKDPAASARAKKEREEVRKPGQVSYAPVGVSRGTPEYSRLLSIIDPVNFMERLALPKLLVWGASDTLMTTFECQMPQLVAKLPGDTAWYDVPNCPHGASLLLSLDSSTAFFRGFLLGRKPPHIKWDYHAENRTARMWQVRGHEGPSVVRWWTNTASAPTLWSDQPVAELDGGASHGWMAQLPNGAHVEAIMTARFEWPEPHSRYVVSTMRFPLPSPLDLYAGSPGFSLHSTACNTP